MKLYQEYLELKNTEGTRINEFFIIFPLSWITGPLKVLYRTTVVAFDKCVQHCGVFSGGLKRKICMIICRIDYADQKIKFYKEGLKHCKKDDHVMKNKVQNKIWNLERYITKKEKQLGDFGYRYKRK
jgi:hypothetical protein